MNTLKMVFSTRQIAVTIAFGLALVFELSCALLILKRDSKNYSNRFTSVAYLCLSVALGLSVSYVIITDETIVTLLQRLANSLNVITAIFLFLAAMYISEGYESFKSYRMVIVVFDLFMSLFLLITPGITVVSVNELPGSEQLIKWDILFFLEATIPLYFTLALACYYYLKVRTDLSDDSPVKRVCTLILIGTVLLGVSHFLLVLPLFIRSLIIDYNSIPLTIVGAIGVLISSLFITQGYRTKIKD